MVQILPLKATQEIVSKDLCKNKNNNFFCRLAVTLLKTLCLSPKYVDRCLLGIAKYLADLSINTKLFVSASKAADIRNYLIFILCATNALKSSKIMEIILSNIDEAIKMPVDFPKWRVIESANYKTSFLYSEKIVCVAKEIFTYTLVYQDYLNPLLIKDEVPNLLDHERYFILKLNSLEKAK